MCLVLPNELENVLLTIKEFAKVNPMSDEFSDNLKDHLADLKEQKKISYCGCDGLFKVKQVEDVIYVYIEIESRIYIFFIGDDACFYKESTHSEVSPEDYEIPDSWNQLKEL
jgi:hypothetical protein